MSAKSNLGLSDLFLIDVNKYDIWDQRECAVGNADVWKAACEDYTATPAFREGIPLKLHQIWIGTRQPPCVWLDTWRIDFMNAFREASEGPSWEYVLWDNDSVRDMHMLNRDLFDAESAPQCQADILRLEVLYEHGGVYVDADIVSTVRDLRPVVKEAEKTGFLITYEPDTKDKPYSVLGNSIIACTRKHPLILMLMAYIKQVYGHKRAHYGVEWVTGPLTYTKVLTHTAMPVTVPPSKDFYPSFHYIPNPSAIDVKKLDSYCFQFGYTCSGLSQWVAENNKCRQAHDCSHHAKVDYSLGKLKQFPSKILPAPLRAEIPATIHQFAFQPEDTQPKRWMRTWKNLFCPVNGFKYELWTWQRLKEEIGSFYCANLYDMNNMDSFAIQMLALEVLQKQGGYYVPLTTTYVGEADDPEASKAIFGLGEDAEYQAGSILGFAAGTCLDKLKKAYGCGKLLMSPSAKGSTALVADMGYGDDVAAFAEFKKGSRYLGASEIYYVPEMQKETQSFSSAHVALTWAYDCQVPIFRLTSQDSLTSAITASGKRVVVITDPQFGVYKSLIDEIPGVMYRLEQNGEDWDFIVINVEWEVDEDAITMYKASSPFRPPTARYLGFIANSEAARTLESANIESILGRFDTGKVFVLSEKSQHSAKLSSIYRTMPVIEHACRSLAGFVPSFESDHSEIQDNLFKGFREGQIAFELQVDNEQRVMFRSWGDGGSVNCECKILPGVNGTTVEWLRQYRDQQVVYETVGASVK